MRTPLASLLCSLLASSGIPAQQPASSDTIANLSRTAGQNLAKSTEELAHLRDQIASAKLPLATELTDLEDAVTKQRREYETVTRSVDTGNLELANLKTTIKARQDELTYVANLLDEYARSFESKVNVSELQYCGKAIDAAKQATENTTLSAAEKFGRQLDLVKVSLKRAAESIGVMRFPGVGVDLQGGVVEGHFALVGPVAVFRPKSGPAGVVVAQTGSTKPLIRPLEGPVQAGIGPLVQDGEGTVPLDPTRGGALKALVQKFNLWHTFEKGGPIMWPLLVASILALGTVVERLFFLMRERLKRDPKARGRLFAEVERGDVANAIAISKGSKDYVVRTFVYALTHKENSLPNALVYAQAQELRRFSRGIPILDTVITLAPLLGLLGTVTGMMGSFSLIGGEVGAPGAITGGIAEALIATAFGLGIAITSLLPFNFLNARLEEARHELESASTQLELLVHPPSGHSNVLLPQKEPLVLAGQG